MRFRICRKEARETGLWLRLIAVGESADLQREQVRLTDEAAQLVKIYSVIIKKLAA